MATYKEIRGVNIQSLESDPTAVEGDVWYNASTSKLRMYATAATWATGNDYNTGRSGKSGGGTQAAAWIASGNDDPAYFQHTEFYDGTTWTEVNNPGENHNQTAGGGTQAAAWMATGTPGDTTSAEEFDGTNWADSNSCNTGNGQRASCGPQTAAMMIGAEPATVAVESYDGTNWTEVANYPVALSGMESVGTNTANITFGGYGSPSYRTEANTFDGSSFTAVPDMNSGTSEMAKAGENSNSAMKMGGQPGTTANVEVWDGTSWTEVANLPQADVQGEGAGSTSAATWASGKASDNSYPVKSAEFTVAVAVETVAFD